MGTIDRERLNALLPKVEKPGRYTGGELNSTVKPEARLRIAISYPDLYEIGMSNNGLKILYEAVNCIEGIACERVFAAAPDFEAGLRETGIPLYTLETLTPLNELDIIGFNISHELLFTNIIQILDLGGIAPAAADRDENAPLVIAGGQGISNPAPYYDIFDLLFFGDGEEGFAEIASLVLERKEAGDSRKEILQALSRIESVYAPAFPPADGARVRKRVLQIPGCSVRPPVPSIRTAHEKAVVETARGCPNLCKFCHAGYYELPFRKTDPLQCADKIFELIKNTGYSEVTFSSLSISDYPGLDQLINAALPGLTEQGVSVSFPSMRVELSTIPLIEMISDMRGASVTLAVESGSVELRERAMKRVRTDELLEVCGLLFKKGWRLLKLYFMLGLPGCEDTDEAEEIIGLVKQVLATSGGRNVELNVTLSPFVPKPHTPFQRERMMTAEYFFDAVRRVKRGLPKRVKIKGHDIEGSLLEAVIARGGSAVGRAAIAAYNKGARLDSWNEHFRPGIWKESLAECGVDAAALLDVIEGPLPWDIVETGHDSLAETLREKRIDLSSEEIRPEKIYSVDTEALRLAAGHFEKKFAVTGRVMVRFSKTGFAKYISHLDLMEIFKRAMRIASVPVSFSQGFNKREKVQAGFPVPLGIESISELIIADLYEAYPKDIIARLNTGLPEGIRALEAVDASAKMNLMSETSSAVYRMSFDDAALMDSVLAELKKSPAMIKKKGEVVQEIPFDSAVKGFIVNTGSIDIELAAGSADAIRIDAVAGQLAGGDHSRIKIVKLSQRVGGKLI